MPRPIKCRKVCHFPDILEFRPSNKNGRRGEEDEKEVILLTVDAVSYTHLDVYKRQDLLLYAVTDRSWLGNETLYEQVEKALKGGATFIQLREKELDEEHFCLLYTSF